MPIKRKVLNFQQKTIWDPPPLKNEKSEKRTEKGLIFKTGHTHTKVNTEDTLSGFPGFFFQHIIKDRSNNLECKCPDTSNCKSSTKMPCNCQLYGKGVSPKCQLTVSNLGGGLKL